MKKKFLINLPVLMIVTICLSSPIFAQITQKTVEDETTEVSKKLSPQLKNSLFKEETFIENKFDLPKNKRFKEIPKQEIEGYFRPELESQSKKKRDFSKIKIEKEGQVAPEQEPPSLPKGDPPQIIIDLIKETPPEDEPPEIIIENPPQIIDFTAEQSSPEDESLKIIKKNHLSLKVRKECKEGEILINGECVKKSK